MRKSILVPIDFSNNAQIASQYALAFAQKYGYDVHFVHVYQAFKSAFQSHSSNEKDSEQAHNSSQAKLDAFKSNLGLTSSDVTFQCVEGAFLTSIQKYIDEHQISLVIMGTHGETGARKNVLGSNTYDLAKNMECSLLIVPERPNEFHLSHAVLFTDYQKGDENTLRSFMDVVAGEQLKYSIVHMHPEVKDPTVYEELELEEHRYHLQKDLGIDDLQMQLIRSKESTSLVKEVVEEMQADILLLTWNSDKNFFAKLFSKSLAKAIIMNPMVPVFLGSK
ncbi:universal stress protein [Sphingobacterium sp.]|uniref:universal stress protein n=1 Tax=Sphingobacterium sp. TaxID=341027 RepID=UPI00289700B1|nr:universal stress protein [Sphingobacterium sp.]